VCKRGGAPLLNISPFPFKGKGDKGDGVLNTDHKPSFIEEEELLARGIRFIAGVDEVGRGSIAGPVVAAAVILPDKLSVSWLAEVRDSKQLSPAKRETGLSMPWVSSGQAGWP